MSCWSADNQEATFEDLAHQVQSFLNTQVGHWKTSEKKGLWTELVRRSTNGTNERTNLRLLRLSRTLVTGILSMSIPVYCGSRRHKLKTQLPQRCELVVMNRIRPLGIAALNVGSATVATMPRQSTIFLKKTTTW